VGNRLSTQSSGNNLVPFQPPGQQAPENTTGFDNEPDPSAPDYNAILAEQQAQIAAGSQTVDKLRRQIAESEKRTKAAAKAFAGGADPEPEISPSQKRINEHNELMDYFLQEGIEGERQGRPIPLTVTLATKFAQMGIEAEQRNQALEKQLADMEGRLARLGDSNFKLTDNAASIMEGMLDTALTQIYGEGEQTNLVREAQFNAIAHRIGQEIKDLQTNDRKTWDRVRRNPKYMKNMVNHFVAEMLPPKVKAMMEQEELQNTPISDDELYEAFKEARVACEAAETEAEAHQYSSIMDEIRQQLIANRYGGGSASKQSLNQILKTYRA